MVPVRPGQRADHRDPRVLCLTPGRRPGPAGAHRVPLRRARLCRQPLTASNRGSRHATSPHRHHGGPPAREDPRAAQPGRPPADIASNDAIDVISSALPGPPVPVRIAVFAAGLPVRGSADSIDPDALAAGSNIKLGGLLRLLHAVPYPILPRSLLMTFAHPLRPATPPPQARPRAA